MNSSVRVYCSSAAVQSMRRRHCPSWQTLASGCRRLVQPLPVRLRGNAKPQSPPHFPTPGPLRCSTATCQCISAPPPPPSRTPQRRTLPSGPASTPIRASTAAATLMTCVTAPSQSIRRQWSAAEGAGRAEGCGRRGSSTGDMTRMPAAIPAVRRDLVNWLCNLWVLSGGEESTVMMCTHARRCAWATVVTLTALRSDSLLSANWHIN